MGNDRLARKGNGTLPTDTTAIGGEPTGQTGNTARTAGIRRIASATTAAITPMHILMTRNKNSSAKKRRGQPVPSRE